MKKLITLMEARSRAIKVGVACLFALLCFTQRAEAALTIWADTVSGTSGTQVDVHVKVRDFTNLIAAQGTVSWNTTVATYVSTSGYGLTGMNASSFGTGQVGAGRLSFSWNDGTLSGVSVPNNTSIFTIRFTLVGAAGSTSPVAFINTPTLMEFIDVNFNTVAHSTLSGQINVSGGGGGCSITALAAGAQTPCASGPNTYTQQVTVTYSNAPGSGSLVVNGQSFAITSSPQTVTLTNLAANGAAVNVTANFSAQTSCTFTANGLFTAPPSCAPTSNLIIFADSVSGNTGTQVDVRIRARNFTDLIAAQGTISWNVPVATYSSVTVFGLPGMTAANFGTGQVGAGRLTFSWNDPTLMGVTLADSATLFTIRYTLVGAAGSATPVTFINTPTPMEFTNNAFNTVTHSTVNGQMRINGVPPGFKIFADSVSGPPAGTVDLAIRANDFINLIAAQGTVSWNTSVATYNSLVSFGLPGMTAANFGTGQVGAGRLSFSWNDPTLVGVTVPDSAMLFTVRFNLVGAAGSATPVTFINTPTTLEFTDNAFNVITHNTRNGEIKIIGSVNTITTGTISGSPFCAGQAVSVPFTVSGTFNAGNVFTAQLSNASGSFASPVNIGTLNGTGSGTISATIPPGTVTGTGYLIRVVSSNPAITGSSNGVNLTINAIPATPTVTAGGPTTFCAGGSVTLTSSSPTGNVWSPGGATTQSITVTNAGSYSVVVTTAGCSSAASAPVTVTVNPLPTTPTITAGGATTFCVGGSVTLTSSSPTGNVWSPGGATTQSITVTNSGTYSVVVNSGGCTSAASNTIAVTVNPLPAVPTITAGGPTTFCSGGSVTLTSSSPTGNVWTPGGATTQSITATASGSYTVQVTNGNGCSATSAATVVTVNPTPATPTITAGGATTFCAGGSVTLTSSSATNNVWSPGGATTQSITVTNSGTYSVVVNNGGCASAASNAITVTVNPLPAVPTITAGGPTTFCSGGSVTLTSSSPTGNVWTPGGATTQSITATASGSYTVQVTNGNGCSATSTATVVTVNPAPATPTITAGGATTFCAGGSVTLTSSSATNNVWSPGGQATQSITVTNSGTYSVVVNNGGCASAASNAITVTVNPLPTAPTVTAGGPTTFCAGGSVTLTSSSPTGNVWTPGGATTQSITATTSGSYTVQFTDGNGCSATSTPTVVTVNPLPTTPTITAGSATTFCAGGSVTLTSSSATNNVWSPGGQTTQSITVSNAGTYYVVVNNGGCASAASNSITVTVNPLPAVPTITAGGPTTFCAGGSVTLTSSSPTGNVWTPGGATTQSITATTSGSYTVQFTDGNGCSATSTPTVVTVNPLPTTPTITAGGPTTFCAGGSVTLTSSSPTNNVWSPGGQTTQSITVTNAGTYSVVVNNGGCTSAASNTITVSVNPTPATPTITAGGATTFCAGGSVTLTSSSATNNVWSPGGATTQSITVTNSGTYSVVVNNGGCASAASNTIAVTVNPLPAVPTITAGGPTSFCAGGSVTLTSSSPTGNLWAPGGATTQSITVTNAGSYTVQVTDANSCSATSAATVVTVNPAPATPTITAGGATTFCAGGSVTLTSSSATNNVWSPGGATTQSITVTNSGTYSVVVNNGGCSSAASNTIAVTVNPLPAVPTITPSGPTTFCSGGSVTLTSSSPTGNVWTPGGATTQSITVTNSGSYTVQVTDANSCSATSAATVVTVNTTPPTATITAGGPTTFCAGGSVTLTSSSATDNVWSPGGATTQSITVTNSGTYSVVVNNGCASATSNTITVTVNPLPAVPTITAGGPTTFCSGGSVTLTSSSPTGNVWTPGGATTQSITATASGSYTVQVTDANSCSATSAATVVTVNPTPATPTITAGGATTFCAGGSVTLTSSSATNNVWSPGGATTQSITVTNSGTYSVVVNNGGCASVASNTIAVTVNPLPAVPTITPSGATTFCSGGSVTLTSSSPTGNVWTPGGATTQSINVTTSGSYTVQVTDANSCSATSTATVVTVNPTPTTPTITAGGPTTFCAGGSVTLTSSSATNNVWSPGGATTQSITVTNAGAYSVVVNNGGCASAASNTINVTVNPAPTTPTITAGGPTSFCSGGSVTLTSSSATDNIWSPGGQTTQSITVTNSGTYSVVVNTGGCASAASNTITVTATPTPTTPTITPSGPTAICTGGSVVLTSSSSSGNIWSPGGATTQSITATTPGSYTVQVVTAGCSSAVSTPLVVTVAPAPDAQYTFVASGLTVNFTNTSLNNPTNFQWNFGDGNTSTSQNPSHTYATPGIYNVCLTVSNGCGADVICQNVSLCVTPAAAFAFAPSNLQVTFTDASTGSPTAWAWDFGDGNTSIFQSPIHTYSTPGTYNVCLITTNGCGADTTCMAITVTCPTPVASFTHVVLGSVVNFTIQSSSGGNATYAWDFGDGNTSTQFNPSHTYANGGNYWVCFTVTTDCGTDQFCDSVSIFCPAPVVNFTWNTVGYTVTFTDATTNTPSQWEWDFGDGNTSTLQNPSHTYAAVGPYIVCLTAINNCDTAVHCNTVNDIVSVEDPGQQLYVNMFPNPAMDEVTLSGEGESRGMLSITVMDLYGRELINSQSVSGQSFSNTISVRGLASGVYLVKVVHGQKSKVLHLVKQ